MTVIVSRPAETGRDRNGAPVSGTDKDGPGAQRPTIAIYQQPEHVAGLLQQLYGQPLVTGETREQGGEHEDTTKRAGDAGAGVGGKGKLPAVGEIEARIEANFGGGIDARNLTNQRTVLEFVYSQAYYLYLVRAALRRQGLIRTISSSADASELRSGDFVEYEATFEADQIATALDILQPTLVSEITSRIRLEKWSKATDWDDYDDFQIKTAQFKATLAAEVSLAAALADAVRVDFRSDKTREYYGRIGEGETEVVAITICDAEHFTVADEDRILDGRFTVLGKVTEGPVENRPILERNKLLDKLSPDTVDALFLQLNELVGRKGAQAFEGRRGDDSESDPMEAPIDLQLDSRIFGTSFKVVPVAIFA